MAQDYSLATGNPTFTTAQPVELGFLNVANGNLHLMVPLGSYPQRGARPFVAGLVYDSRIWQVLNFGSGNTWQPTNVPNSQGGWRFVTSVDAGSVNWSGGNMGCWVGDLITGYWENSAITRSNFTWTDTSGATHVFPNYTSQPIPAPDCPPPSNIPTSSAYATDATGLFMSVANYSNVIVYAGDGTQLYPSVKDTNGNYFSLDQNGNVIDTLQRTPITKTVSGNTTTYAVLNSQGSRSSIAVTTTTISVSTTFGQSGVTEYSGTLTVIQRITLPDNTFYQFGYDSYGEVNSITFPTGGQVTYGYTNFQDSFGNKNRWATSRTSGGGTWSYSPQVITTCASGQVGCQENVTVTKPSGDNAVYSFTLNNGAWESQVQYYTGAVSGANLIASVAKTWDFSQACQPTPCTGASNIRTLRVMTTFSTLGSSVTKKVEMTYADTNTMNVSAIKAWKFGAGDSPPFPASPDRETDLTYHAVFGNNITNRVVTSKLKDGSGNLLAQTTFSYDDSGALLDSTPATGIANHDDTNYGLSNTVRGNLTKIQHCTVLTSCSASYTQTAMTYDTTGQILSGQDPNGNTTTLGYADKFYKDVGDGPANPPQLYSAATPTSAYLTSLTPPLIPASTYGYYYGTGQPALFTDANGQTTYSHFFDSAFSRPTSMVLPNGGWSYAAYSASATQIDTYVGITGAFATSGCTGCRQDEVLLDNLGRPTTQKLVSDPEGLTSVARNYDSTGRALSDSHPYRSPSDPTYGLETPTYDGLNRIIKTMHPDSTYSQVLFGAAVSGTGVNQTQLCSATTYGLGYPVLVIDEAGKKRETWVDGLGRTIEGDEPDSSGNLTSYTCYSYDAVGNLLQVVHGSQNRTYAYDALSRLTSVTIPELANSSGQNCSVTYAYDNNSNVLTRTAPAPNQTSCTSTVTTNYSYDALNRLKQISYSDGTTPTVKYGYDGVALTGCSTSPPSLTDSNPKGRMTSMCDGSGAASWAHDATGNILTEARAILGITKILSYSYNLDRSIATVTYPSGKTVTYTVSNAQRLTAAKDTSSGTQFAIAASYAAPGGLQGMITGQVSGGFAGITESHTYNTSLEYKSTKATSSAGTALDLGLTYNLPGGDNGTVTGITNNVDNGRTQSFVYDPLNRISSANSQATSGADCWGQSFSPDPLANLNTVSVTQCSGFPLSVTVDGNNHINSSTAYAYDAAGNMTRDGSGLTYTFDAENRLTLASGMSGGPYCYVYDGKGLRVAKKSSASSCSSGTVTKIYWRSVGGDALAETDGTGSTTNSAYNEYVLFAGRRIASRNGPGAIFFYFADQLGSTRTMTTGSGPGQTPGQLCYDADFTPYGQEISHSERLQTSACPPNYKFTGYERDPETGLDYAFARYYSSGLGRFLSTDPLGGAIGNLQSHNAYTYVTNNPVDLADPTGMDPCIVEPCGLGQGSGASCSLDGIDVSCDLALMAAGIAPGAIGEFNLLTAAFSATGGHWEYTDCLISNDGCVLATAEWRTDYGNLGLLSLLGGTSFGRSSAVGPGSGSSTDTRPCPYDSILRFDYNTPRKYKYGNDAPINHITTFHINASPGKSQYIFQSNVTDLADKQAFVMKLNILVFLLGTPKVQDGTIAYTYTFAPLLDPKTRRVYAGIGRDVNDENRITNTATFVVEKNCKTVVTSFPGSPGGATPQP